MSATTVGTIGLNMVLNSAGFKRSMQNVQSQANTASQKMAASFRKIGASIAAAFSAKMVISFAKECTTAADVQTEAETKLTTVMRQRMKATNSAVQQIKDYTSAQQELGVVGDEVQISGVQQLSTFLNSENAIKTLIPAMNNLAVQQNGVNVSASNMVNIGNLMGKVMQGQTSALTRVGITFNEAQEHVLKYGDEQERAATLAQVITDNVGEMNKALANTPAGQIQKLKNSFGDMQEIIGRSLQNVFTPLLKYLNTAVEKFAQLSAEFEKFTQKLFGNANSTTVATNASLSNATDSVSALTGQAEGSSSALDGIADSAEKAKRSIAGFDKLNIISENEVKTETNSSADSTKTNLSPSNNLTSAMSKAIDKFSATWDSKGKKVINSIKNAFTGVKDAVTSIGNSWRDVWNNGTGKKVIDNIKTLLSNVFNIIGDISGAFTKAWQKGDLGNQVVQSIIDKWNSLIELINTVAEDFREVWNDGTGERIWGNILEIIRNCNNATKTLREKIKEAWDKNDTGKKIWQDILGIVEDITEFANDISEIHLEWLENLDLSPVTESVEKLAGAFREFLKACGDKLKTAYENILLPLAKWTIEKAVPKLVEALAEAFKLLGKFIKKIPISVLAGVATAIGTIVFAFKGFKIAKEVKKNFDVIKAAFINFKDNVLMKHPYALAISGIAAAVTGLIAAMKTYSNEQWSNSSLKKEIDKTAELADEWNDLADDMSTKIEEINETELTMKADFEVVDKMKERLQEIIEDGTIDESEEGDYKTIVDLLGEKVDGFKDDWNTLTLEEIDGKIVIKDNIDDVNQKLDELVNNWEIAQAELTFSEVYSNLQTDTIKQKIKMDVEDKENNSEKSKQELIDYIYEKSSLSKKEAKLLTDELIKQKGDFDKTNKALKEQFENNSLSDLEYQNLYFLLNNNSKRSFTSAFGWNDWDNSVSDGISKAVNDILELNDSQAKTENSYNALIDIMGDYKTALDTINGGSKDYNDYIKLSTEYGLSHDAVLSLLKDDGITTWEELEAAAKKSSGEVNSSLNETNESWDENSRRAKASSRDTTVTITKSTAKVKSDVDSNLKNGVPNAISEMVSKIKTAIDPIKNVFANAFGGIWGGIQSPMNFVLGKVEDFVNNFNSGLSRVGGKIFNGADVTANIVANVATQNLKLPRLAKGGIVKAPTLAVVGDNAGANTGNPEVIAPLNKLQTMINNSGGQDVAILTQILDYLKRIYEMFIIFRNNGGNMYEFVAKLNGSTLFNEIVNQNELYKKRHNGKSAFL